MTAQPKSDNPEDFKMPLIEHLTELRKRLLWAALAWFITTIACFYFAKEIFNFLAVPLQAALKKFATSPNQIPRIVFDELYGPFFTHIKIALYFGLFISFPIFAYQVWKFVAPGLYKNERAAFVPFLVATPFLFFAGGAFCYYLVFPMAFEFFIEYGQSGGPDGTPIEALPSVKNYFALVIKLIFAFGLCFLTPVVLTLMVRAGVASSAGLAAKRRYAVVAIFVIAALITPPDAMSMLLLAIPMCILYEVSIWIGRLIEKERAKREAELDAELRGEATKPKAAGDA